jgi:TonB family protein
MKKWKFGAAIPVRGATHERAGIGAAHNSRMQTGAFIMLGIIVASYACAEDAVVDAGAQAWLTPQALVVVPPEYPPALLGKTPNGYVDLAFGIAKDGTMRQPHAVAGDLPGAFADAVLDVAKLWRFQYKLYDDACVPIAEGEQRYRLRVWFETEADKPHIFIEQTARKRGATKKNNFAPVKRVEPRFPKILVRRGIKEGCIVARMHITEAGDVERVDILKSDPAGLFDEAAKRALLEWKFPAGGIPEKPGAATGEVQVVFYLPDRAHGSGTIEAVGTYPGGPLNPPHPR